MTPPVTSDAQSITFATLRTAATYTNPRASSLPTATTALAPPRQRHVSRFFNEEGVTPLHKYINSQGLHCTAEVSKLNV